MKTEEQIFYKKVYIHSEDDLPKEAGFYFVNWTHGHAHNTTMGVVYYDESIKGLWFGKGWYDWYLIPVSLPSDEEIEEMLWEEINIPLSQKDKVFNTDAYKQYQETLYWMGWMRDNITAK